MSCDNDRELIDKTMAGLAKNELSCQYQSLAGTVDDQYPFLIDPMPNCILHEIPLRRLVTEYP